MPADKPESMTPLYDALRPKYQAFLDKYITCFVAKRAALAAGYTTHSATAQGAKIMARQEMIDAIAEAVTVRRAAAEQSRQAVIDRLGVMAHVTLADLTCMDKEKGRLRILFPHEMEEELWPALGLVAYTREGNVEFRGAIQQKAIHQLASYMLWDKQMRDDNPAVQFDFKGLK